jgi:L-amino acid N-acyltransferase YncA
MTNVLIRPIEEKDDGVCANLIVDVLEQFDVLGDETIADYANLTANFQSPNSLFVAVVNDEIVGTVGLNAHSDDNTFPRDTVELCKFYVKSRGVGIGKMLFQKAIETARQQGYKKVRNPDFRRSSRFVVPLQC